MHRYRSTAANIDPALYEKGQDAFVQLILSELLIGHECCQLVRSGHLSDIRASSLLQMAWDALSMATRIFWQLDAGHKYLDDIVAQLEQLRTERTVLDVCHLTPSPLLEATAPCRKLQVLTWRLFEQSHLIYPSGKSIIRRHYWTMPMAALDSR